MTAGFELTTSVFSTGVTPKTFFTQDTNDYADAMFARHVQFQEKEVKLRLLNWIFFKKIFSTEKVSLKYSSFRSFPVPPPVFSGNSYSPYNYTEKSLRTEKFLIDFC